MSSADLVGQLREKSGWRSDVHGELHWLAADEIQRLRLELAETQGHLAMRNSDLQAEQIRCGEIEAETREACAKIAETAVGPEAFYINHQTYRLPADGRQIATAIRASASTPKGGEQCSDER